MFTLHCLSWVEFAWGLSPNLEAHLSYIYNGNFVDFQTAVVLITHSIQPNILVFKVSCDNNVSISLRNGQEQCILKHYLKHFLA